ncbi:hypothetical protein CYK05_06835 [Rothia mucilaginosa]|nr:hypothetical protein CYK05_06835 [Rothia mucilaginosa]
MLLKNISQIFLHGLGAADWQAKANCSRGGVIRKRHQGVRSEARTGAPVGAWITPSLLHTLCIPVSPSSKNIERLTYEATPNSATVDKLCFQPAQAHPRIRYRRIHVL